MNAKGLSNIAYPFGPFRKWSAIKINLNKNYTSSTTLYPQPSKSNEIWYQSLSSSTAAYISRAPKEIKRVKKKVSIQENGNEDVKTHLNVPRPNSIHDEVKRRRVAKRTVNNSTDNKKEKRYKKNIQENVSREDRAISRMLRSIYREIDIEEVFEDKSSRGMLDEDDRGWFDFKDEDLVIQINGKIKVFRK